MQAIAVFSLSTTTESMLRPRMVVTAMLYLLCVGLQRSITRPLTPGKVRLRFASVSLNLASRSLSCLSTPACWIF